MSFKPVRNLADLLNFLRPPTKFLDFVEKKDQEGTKMSEDSRTWVSTWRRIDSGEPVPELDQFDLQEATTEGAAMSLEKALEYINKAEDIAGNVVRSLERLEKAIVESKRTFETNREYEIEVKTAEAEVILMDEEEKLKGLAKTSQEYKSTVAIMLKDAAKEGELADVYAERDKRRTAATKADIEFEQAKAAHRAALGLAEHNAAMLRLLAR